jgi:hypothetical protein
MPASVPAAHDAVKAVRNDSQQAEVERLQHPRLVDYWSGLLIWGLKRHRGNSSTTAPAIAGKASRIVPKNKLTFITRRSIRKTMRSHQRSQTQTRFMAEFAMRSI